MYVTNTIRFETVMAQTVKGQERSKLLSNPLCRGACTLPLNTSLWNDLNIQVCVSPAGFKTTPAAFFIFMFTVTLVAYTATAMTMAISADQSVVAMANIFMTISFVFMMVSVGTRVQCGGHMRAVGYSGTRSVHLSCIAMPVMVQVQRCPTSIIC